MKPNIVTTYPFTRECSLPLHGPGCAELCNLSVITLEAKETPTKGLNNTSGWCLNRKNVVFVVDVSTSMHYTLPSVKASILAFRDLMCGREKPSQPPVTDEKFVATLPNFHLITFSDVAKLRWSNSGFQRDPDVKTFDPRGAGTLKTFDDLVASLEVEGSTNMGEGIELAYSLCPQGGAAHMQGPDARASWIVVLTDGESNQGKYQSVEAFTDLALRIPPNAKIISLGYGTEFNMHILDSIGDFTYLQDSESIPGFMGSLAHEISTCSVLNVRIGFPQRPDEDKDNLKDLRSPRIDIVFGSQNVGWFADGRKHYFGFIGVWGVPPRCYETGEVIHVHYTMITEGGIYHYQISERVSNPTGSEPIPVHIKREIASAKASNLIKVLYECNRRSMIGQIERTLKTVEKWTAEGEEEPRETVRRVCRELRKAHEDGGVPATPMALQTSNALTTQSSYTDTRYLTPGSVNAKKHAIDLSKTYVE